MRRLWVLTVTGVLLWSSSPALSREPQNVGPLQYRVLATSRTSTMERERRTEWSASNGASGWSSSRTGF